MKKTEINMFKIGFFVLFYFFALSSLWSQEKLEKLDSVSLEITKSNKKYIKVCITNNKKSSIYFMSNKYSCQKAYKLVTNCDTLNSTSYSKPINLSPNFYSKKRMTEIKSGDSRKIKFKLSSKYFGVNKCDSSKRSYLFLKAFVYQFDKEEKVKVIGYLFSKERISIE
jgi:hypothetical protein